ncbi:magnesium protoporphyrin IX methyltransferase [Candidatus Chloroploca asiatica]|uniref:Magnesium protoporphyrin IX methyltransferase n=1 Tax=Candidatus Chloroploca asiatica TaxID=1506545 RepID=A0A2H3KNH9_9CHLR|nr:magnesium protoporphyrin IX methyltransferase [Candidatus Chloroploca asiatica]PDV98937.1 magnesium protoporphyrin IX methyltransferase [Candidatus Chloroploca asiatica]
MDLVRHKAQLRQYFNGVGFERWSAIYGQAELSPIRRSIRQGHTTMLAVASQWLDATAMSADATALDAGCGTGLFTLELARRGFQVTATDLAPQMVAATAEAAAQAGLAEQVTTRVADVEELQERYDVVACFDVLIHYPAQPFALMLAQLSNCCEQTLLFTYAPHSTLLAALHRVGGFFPRSQRRTTIQMIPDALVRSTLADAGMKVCRAQRISCGFYHVTLVQAQR